jgi:hypothetical protein
MIFGEIPEQFQEIDLDDRRTWHRATMREWLDHRFFLQSQLEDGEGEQYPDSMTLWERKFLSATDCLEEALVQYERGFGPKTTMGLLFDWIVNIEDAQNLARSRSNKRKRNRDAVAQSSDRRMKSKQNPYYPRPAELIHIDRVTQVIVANLVREFDAYCTNGDEITGEPPSPEFAITEYVQANPWKHNLLRFMAFMKRFGYRLHVEEQEVLAWEGWSGAPFKSRRTTNRAFLSFLFAVSEQTIRRDVSKSRLEAAYNRCGLAEKHRVYVEKNTVPQSANLLKSGWTTRLVDGAPNVFDIGPTYDQLPHYEEPDR